MKEQIAEYPKGRKSEWETQVQSLIAEECGGNTAALRYLLQFMKDASWPGAASAVDYLEGVGERVKPYVLEVLESQDDTWRYNVLYYIVAEWPRHLHLELAPVLKNLATLSGRNSEEELCFAATELLCEHKLLDAEELRSVVSTFLINNPQTPKKDRLQLLSYLN